MELYQLVLKGHYLVGGTAEYRDTDVYKSKEAITDEYVREKKEMLLNRETFLRWTEDPVSDGIMAPIEEYIQKLNLAE